VSGLFSERHYTRFGVGAGDLAQLHAVMEGKRVRSHDGTGQAGRSLQSTPLDVCSNCENEPGAVFQVECCRFYRMFVTYAANVKGFKFGCRLVLFVDGTHLSGTYKGTLLTTCVLDADSHLLNFAYAIVCSEKVKEWVWFLQMVAQCLGALKPVIKSNRHPVVAQAFGKEYHSYCLRHLTENFFKEAGKHGIRKEATKQIMKEMLYKVAYAPTRGEDNVALEELHGALGVQYLVHVHLH